MSFCYFFFCVSDQQKDNNEEKQEKDESINIEKNKAKNHNLAMKFWNGFKKVWRQTFPSDMDVEEIFEKRKEEAIKFKSELVEFTDEQIDEVFNYFLIIITSPLVYLFESL